SVDPDDGAGLADELRDEDRDVAAASPDVEDAHPARHACLDEEQTRHRFDQRCLIGQPPQLDLRMAEDVGSGLTIASSHEEQFPLALPSTATTAHGLFARVTSGHPPGG